MYVVCSCGSLGNNKVALFSFLSHWRHNTCMTRGGRSSGEYQEGGKHVFYSERDGFEHAVNCSIRLLVLLQLHLKSAHTVY